MRLSFKFNPKLSHKQLVIINELAWHCSKLYNIVNYQIKNNKDVKAVYTELETRYKNNWHNDYLHSHNRQQALKQLAQDWKSFFNSLKDYKKNPQKYKGQPGSPNFKHMNSNPCEIIFTNLAVRIKDNKLLLSLSKKIQSKYNVKSLNFELPEAVQSIIDLDAVQQIKIKQDRISKRWYLLIIYKTEEIKENNNPNIMAVDLGLDNLATLTFKNNSECYIINGKTIKSKNSYFNKEIARLQSIRMRQLATSKIRDTKRIKYLRLKRRNYISNYLHKASCKIVDLAIENQVETIVIGDIKNIKQCSKLKSFVQIPIQRLKKLIEYKAKLKGIKVVEIDESYTSGCSSVDLEKINKSNYDKSRRITRGLFKTNEGLLINADQNGSFNILRKYHKDKCILRPIKEARDNGFVDNPSRLRVS
ncbi:RNA-guided endonuclease InsQ/TnpB family protein [Halanaerobium hydrogeniformans]|uniref:Transposase, IS605 OrfB family n=1 Tax=Halanaerobium hydrogeniformans TaxID=656519 RepID=E4RPN4_HALHG|nr:RNA-guided endonuclease TnpB family protein [Halanaerobium hydrogeniformans]ADQ13918.1 transposase, IS605 OrfB family [Halanaerobium hydrogeniformans]